MSDLLNWFSLRFQYYFQFFVFDYNANTPLSISIIYCIPCLAVLALWLFCLYKVISFFR